MTPKKPKPEIGDPGKEKPVGDPFDPNSPSHDPNERKDPEKKTPDRKLPPDPETDKPPIKEPNRRR